MAMFARMTAREYQPPLHAQLLIYYSVLKKNLVDEYPLLKNAKLQLVRMSHFSIMVTVRVTRKR
jgi:hypothetical protein